MSNLHSPVVIQLASSSDLEAIYAIEKEVHIKPWNMNVLNDSLKGEHLCWKLECGEQILGFIVVMQAGDQLDVLNVAVATAYQGNGLGSQLMSYLIDYARKQQKSDVFLEVRETNSAAIALYEKFGFIQVGFRKSYYAGEQGREDALVMQWFAN